MSLEIITIGGIDILAQIFNAIAAITSNASFFNLMGAAETLGVAACVLRYVQRHDLKDLGKWLIFFVFINGILLTPKVDLLFTDKIYTTKVKKVDNVPVGIAAPFYIFSLGGNALAEMYDKFLSQPNDVRYTNTGMLFGQRLLDSSFNMTPKDSRFQGNMANFVESCVIPDVEINHKYTYRDIFESKDIAQFFFNTSLSPSQARTMFYTGANNSREYITCRDGTARLKTDLDNMLTVAKKNRKNSNASISKSKDGSYKVLGYSPNMYDIPEDMTSQIHLYLMGSSKSATDIYKQNILVNKLRRDFQFVPAAFDGTSDMVGNAAEQAQMKWRLANLTSYQVASKTLPALYAVFSALLVGIFPIIILAMFVTELTGSIIKSYMGFLFSLMLYPVLFAIFNSIVNVLTHQTLAGEDFTISNADTIRSNLADIGATAGYLMMSIPFISFGLIKGLGQAVSGAGSYLGNALSSATSAESSQVSTGNYNYGNMQMENVNGFKTDLNSSFRSGQSTHQNDDGLLISKFGNGRTSIDATQAMSKLNTNINWSSALSSTYQQSASAEQRKSEEAQRGYRNSITEATNIANGFQRNHGKTTTDGYQDTYGSGTNDNTSLKNTRGSHITEGAKTSHSSDSRITDQERLEKSVSAGVSAKAGVEFLGSGASVHANAQGSYANNSSTDSSNSRQRIGDELVNLINTFDKTKDITKFNNDMHQLLNGEITNDTKNTINSVMHSVNQANDSFVQATESNSKAKVYSELASKSQSITQTVSEDLNSQFVNYLYQSGHYTNEDIEKMLSPVPSSEMKGMRDSAISAFLQNNTSMIEQAFNNNQNRVDDTYNNIQVDKYGSSQSQNASMPIDIDGLHRKNENTGHVSTTKEQVEEKMKENNENTGHVPTAKEQIEENRKRNNAQFIMRDAMFEAGQVHSGRIIEANNLKIDADNKKKQLDNYYISKEAESLQSKAPKQPKK